MKSFARLVVACVLAVRLVRGSPGWGRSNAYIDPGSGSFIIQVLIAVALGSVLSVRLWWGRVLGVFRKTKSDGVPERGGVAPSDSDPSAPAAGESSGRKGD